MGKKRYHVSIILPNGMRGGLWGENWKEIAEEYRRLMAKIENGEKQQYYVTRDGQKIPFEQPPEELAIDAESPCEEKLREDDPESCLSDS